MTDDFDAQLVSALRTLERDPVDDGRGAVARRVRHRRARGVAGAAAVALVVGIGIGAVIANNDDSPRHLTVGQSGATGPTAPPISAASTGVLTWPTTVAPGDEFAAVLRNPLPAPNTSCFVAVRLERWDGDAWGAPRELLPEGVDPNLAGPGADCHPDLVQPGAFIGERKFVVPRRPRARRLPDRRTVDRGQGPAHGARAQPGRRFGAPPGGPVHDRPGARRRTRSRADAAADHRPGGGPRRRPARDLVAQLLQPARSARRLRLRLGPGDGATERRVLHDHRLRRRTRYAGRRSSTCRRRSGAARSTSSPGTTGRTRAGST